MRATERELEDAMWPPLEEPPVEFTSVGTAWVIVGVVLLGLLTLVAVLA